jgi:hypothetical protein
MAVLFKMETNLLVTWGFSATSGMCTLSTTQVLHNS